MYIVDILVECNQFFIFNKQYKHYLLTIYSSVCVCGLCARYDLPTQT
jgi:hypothetical protein